MELTDLKGKNEKELLELLEVAQKKTHEMSFALTLGKLKKTDEISKNKKLIARILTLLAEAKSKK
jgi:ribosomal protein L29